MTKVKNTLSGLTVQTSVFKENLAFHERLSSQLFARKFAKQNVAYSWHQVGAKLTSKDFECISFGYSSSAHENFAKTEVTPSNLSVKLFVRW